MGILMRFHWYSRALSSAEIAAIYDAGSAGKCLAPLNRVRLRVSLNPDGSTRLQFFGNNGKSYQMEVSTDLLHWVPVGTCSTDSDGNVEFTDPIAWNQPRRFYRAVEQ